MNFEFNSKFKILKFKIPAHGTWCSVSVAVGEYSTLAVKLDPRGQVERVEVRMLAQVTTTRVKSRRAERLRFPWR
jgi:hypothetical protein